MPYKAAIFDISGTLVHSTPEYRHKMVGKAIDSLGGRYTTGDIDRFWFETGRKEIIEKCFGLDCREFWKIFRQMDNMDLRREHSYAYDDTDFVQQLKQSGVKVGAVTGAPPKIADLEIGLVGKHYFDYIVVASEVKGSVEKPDPRPLLECTESLGVPACDCLYIGNSEEDVLTARNANITDVLIRRGEHNFPHVRPTILIDSLYELRIMFSLQYPD